MTARRSDVESDPEFNLFAVPSTVRRVFENRSTKTDRAEEDGDRRRRLRAEGRHLSACV
jgi:hypothetical protein